MPRGRGLSRNRPTCLARRPVRHPRPGVLQKTHWPAVHLQNEPLQQPHRRTSSQWKGTTSPRPPPCFQRCRRLRGPGRSRAPVQTEAFDTAAETSEGRGQPWPGTGCRMPHLRATTLTTARFQTTSPRRSPCRTLPFQFQFLDRAPRGGFRALQRLARLRPSTKAPRLLSGASSKNRPGMELVLEQVSTSKSPVARPRIRVGRKRRPTTRPRRWTDRHWSPQTQCPTGSPQACPASGTFRARTARKTYPQRRLASREDCFGPSRSVAAAGPLCRCSAQTWSAHPTPSDPNRRGSTSAALFRHNRLALRESQNPPIRHRQNSLPLPSGIDVRLKTKRSRKIHNAWQRGHRTARHRARQKAPANLRMCPRRNSGRLGRKAMPGLGRSKRRRFRRHRFKALG